MQRGQNVPPYPHPADRPRPFDFWSTVCNEGELLEKFNIQLSPIPLPEMYAEMKKWKNEKTEVAKMVEGSYIHHVAAIHGDVVPVIYEACKYIGVKPDLYDPIEDKVQAYLHGEDVASDEV